MNPETRRITGGDDAVGGRQRKAIKPFLLLRDAVALMTGSPGNFNFERRMLNVEVIVQHSLDARLYGLDIFEVSLTNRDVCLERYPLLVQPPQVDVM